MNPAPQATTGTVRSPVWPIRILGWAVVLIGFVILAGWIGDLEALKSLTPGMVAIKANTAIGFILLGTALALQARREPAAGPAAILVARVCAGLAALIGLLTLGEYATGANLGLDQLFFQESAQAFDTVNPGRMAVATAAGFLLLGTALLLLSTRRAAWTGWLALPSSLLSILAFVGYLYDLPMLATFGPFTPIAPPTAMLLLLLGAGAVLAAGGGLLAWLRRELRSLGFAAALLLLLAMGGAVVRNAHLLVENAGMVAHTHAVLETLTATLSDLQDVETGQRGYLLTGDRRFLEPYPPAVSRAREHLQQLRALVADNPEQQARLGQLARLVERKIANAQLEIVRQDQGDSAAARTAVAAGEGRQIMDDLRQAVDGMQQAEKRLLRQRQARADSSTRKTLLTLRSGLLVSFGLLVGVFLLLRSEIARRTRVEGALRRSEESLAVTLDSIGDAVLATDTQGNLTRMNGVAEMLTGWTEAEARGRPIAEVFHILNEATRAPAVIPVDRVLATGEIHGLANHTVLLARDGMERPIADSAAPIRDRDGRILGVVLVFRDVTAERDARRALEASEARYRTLFNSIDEGFCIIEMIFDARGRPVDYRFLEINTSFERHTGMKNAQGRRMREFAPDHETHWFETYGRIAVTGEPKRFQNRAEQLGRTYDVYAFRFGEPEKRQVAILFTDITEREKARAELDRFFTLSLDFLCIASADGYFKRVSPTITDMLGWTPEEFLARPFMEFVHPDDHAATRREVEMQVVAGQKVLQFENRYRHKDGSWRTLSWRSVPHGSLMYATARDVTELRLTEEKIRRLNSDLQRHAAQLEAANQELESFSYSVSHDLRAPLRHVQGYVEMLTRETAGQLSEKAQRYMKTIAEAGRDMGQLIDDLLSFSRMGRTEMREQPVDLGALVADTRRELEAQTPGRNIQWRIAGLPPVLGDQAMLRQVLANLLGNAVKYTRQRDPAVIEIAPAGREDGRVVLLVRDNGAGFDMQYAAKLFGVFQRLHRADEFEGTGIGLANVRRIIARHGGRTWAEGQVGAGATFYFTLQPAPS